MRAAGRATLLVSALAAAVVLGACGSEESAGSAAPAPQSDRQDSAAPSSGAAPAVEEPLDTAKLEADPCSALSASATADLGVEGPGTKRKSTGGVECSWNYPEVTTGALTIAALTDSADGLNDIYAQQDRSAYFEPTEIGGYPAVLADRRDDRSNGRCGLYVGVSDKLAFWATTQIDKGADKSAPCPIAEKLAESAVQTLRAGS